MTIIPIILSGGSGTRLWPLSRESRPKQFLKFGSQKTLFQETILRCESNIFSDTPIVIGADAHRFLIAEDLLELNISADIILEPCKKNSCAAIAAGCLQALKRSPDAIVLVLSADHKITDVDAFSNAVQNASADAKDGFLVTFGVKPTSPATGYGYIKPAQKTLKGGCAKVEQFIEKPTQERASQLITDGCLWNSGNFLIHAGSFLEELKKYQPEILDAVKAAHAKATTDMDFLRLDKAAFENSPSISVDYAVLEKTDKAAVMPVSYDWSDVGSWDVVRNISPKNSDGNSIIGDGKVLGGDNNFILSQNQLVALIGIKNTTVISTRDCVLVVADNHAQEVKTLVEELKNNGKPEANQALQIFRPWGNYEQLDVGEGYQVKRLIVKPGGILSLQKHQHRAEHWVVVSGVAEVTIDTKTVTLEPNQSMYIPQGAVHRLANNATEPVVMIEVQTGDYLGEDDIVRLEDIYNRGKNYVSN